MPKEIDVDALRAEGAVIFTIGGVKWYAAEPDIDTMVDVLDASPDAPAVPKADADGELDEEQAAKALAEGRDFTKRNLESLLPQLRKLLVRADDEGNPLPPAKQPTEAKFNEHMRKHLSVKRAGAVLAEVLGEGQAAPTAA